MPHTPINQDEINKAVWAACDTFRGTVDPSIYKDFILTMLALMQQLLTGKRRVKVDEVA